MADDVNKSRRTLLGASALGLVAAQLGILASANAQESNNNGVPASGTAGTSTGSFGPLKHVKAGVLSIAYAEAGPADGPPVILFHGWPYDIHSFVDVAPILAAAGYRVLIPYLRGYGDTRFLSASTLRNGQPSALAVDATSFMDALKIDKAIMGGFDWGGRNANLLAISAQTVAKRVTPRTLKSSTTSSGSKPRRNGRSMTRRSSALQRRLKIRTSFVSRSITIAGP
jgi:hypothetical protein